MTKSVKEALKFLSKNEQGMFLVYEQGDVSCFYFSVVPLPLLGFALYLSLAI